ncbi:Serine/threonine-protein kinase pkn1 [Candidatus Magnetomorum sp. HK-1]|nr:Serine/threonine-protein kinase pkn1 [Candidatus Magnetomorum sp. HK-1]
MLKKVKFFLASSGELKEEREKIALFISQENKTFVKQDVFMELVEWEELLHSFRGERIQDYFNEEMLKCDILIALFYKKVGQFTKEEFDIAYKNLKDGRNPKHMFVFFKEANIPMSEITEDVMAVVKLKNDIKRAEQIYDTFDSTQDLILKLKRQLEKIIQDLQASLEKHQIELLEKPTKRTIEEIESEYNKIPDELYPCFEAKIDDLSWKIIERYTDKIKKDLLKKYPNSKEKIISELGFYSPINHSEKNLLHKSAVLCFHKSPQTIFPQARSVLVIGNKYDDKFIRRDVNGPLSEQVKKLIELIKDISFIDENGERRDIESIDSNLIRELISNAINHRDYNSSQNVQVSIDENKIEIQSPGEFPPNMNWKKLINSEIDLSHPINRRVSEYLRNLLYFEGIGRGFSIVKKYIDKHGPKKIVFQETHGPTTVISVFFKNSILVKHSKQNKISENVLRVTYLKRILTGTGMLYISGIDPNAAGDKNDSLNIGSIYTALKTQSDEEIEHKDISKHAKRLSALSMLNKYNHLVLLGEPGSGKSSFVNFVAFCIAGELLQDKNANLDMLTSPLPDDEGKDNKEKQEFQHGSLLPVRIILRDFVARGFPDKHQLGNASDLWNFIEKELIEAKLEAFIPHLDKELKTNGGLILLDGLDEVPEANNRRIQLKRIVEDFSASFNKCRILVTGRTYAYQKQNFKLQGFTASILAPFEKGQIIRFVEQWYRHIAEIKGMHIDTALGNAEILKSAIFSNKRLKELSERPLLLTLMASLHAWRGGSLPENREELYADSVDLLLDWWERPKTVKDITGKILAIQPGFMEWLNTDRTKIRRLLNDLAYHAHKDQPDLVGTADVPEDKLASGMMNLCDGPDANPKRLLEYLRDRAGILVSRGIGIYTFPHRTFQEYLSACYLTDKSFPKLVAELARKEPERWREVALLAGAKAARGSYSNVWTLSEALCFHDPEKKQIDEKDIRGAYIAGQLIYESGNIKDVAVYDQPKLDRIKKWQLHIMKNNNIPSIERAEAGNILSQLGDVRDDVITLEKMKFCYVPSGKFLMGSDKKIDSYAMDEEMPQHQVDLLDYFISKYPVTNAQYQYFIDDGGYLNESYWEEAIKDEKWKNGKIKSYEWAIKKEKWFEGPSNYGRPFDLSNHPVVGLSWYEAIAFTRWLTDRWQKKKRLKKNEMVRLPTEAEWEKASRGGFEVLSEPLITEIGGQQEIFFDKKENRTVQQIYSWGNQADINKMNYRNTKIGSTSTVGCFSSGKSIYGCEEMNGNVWEWCMDWFGKYEQTVVKNPMAANTGSARVLRGGSWIDDAWDCRSAFRFRFVPGERFNFMGLRISLGLQQLNEKSHV